MKLKKISIVAVSFAALILCFNSARAQVQPPMVGITPASVEAKITPGSSYTQVFTISNDTPVRLRFNCSVGDVWYDAQNQRITARAGTLPHTAANWIQFSPTEVVVEANSQATVKATITVPPSAAGSYYAMPDFEGMPADQPAPGATPAKGSTAAAAIGVRFRGVMMMTTTTGAEYNVEIMGGKVTPPSASSELEMALDIKNGGTAHANLRGAFAILNAAGTLVGRGSLDDKRFLPGQRKNLTAHWLGDLLPMGKYTCVITLNYDRVGSDPNTVVYELPFEVR